MSYIEKEKLIKADIASIENRVRHAFNQGYDLGYKEGKANCSKNSTGSTTKNDLGVDAVSRNAVINQIFYSTDNNGDVVLGSALRERIARLPSVTPQEPRCKNCKWWKDSDGEYRRGCGAESQCPINRREVFEGNGYCFLFEPQESEGKK